MVVFISFIDYDQAFNKALENIKTHWDTLAELPVVIEDDIYNLDNKEEYFRNEVKTLLDFEEWIDSLLKVEFTASQLPIDLTVKPSGNHLYPECLLTCKHELAVEFRYLLPDTPSVRAILPVLMVGYIVKRRGEKSDCYDRSISRPLCSLLTHDKSRIPHFKREIDKQFRLSKSDKAFPKLKYEQLKSPSILEQKLSPSGIAVLFLFLAHKTKNLCNLPLSFALFEEFTGYLSLFDDILMNYLGIPVNIEDEELQENLIACLNSFFETDHESVLHMPIDIFIMNFVDMILSREADAHPEDTNKWAYDNIVIRYRQHREQFSAISAIFHPGKRPSLVSQFSPEVKLAFQDLENERHLREIRENRKERSSGCHPVKWEKRKELSSRRHPVRRQKRK